MKVSRDIEDKLDEMLSEGTEEYCQILKKRAACVSSRSEESMYNIMQMAEKIMLDEEGALSTDDTVREIRNTAARFLSQQWGKVSEALLGRLDNLTDMNTLSQLSAGDTAGAAPAFLIGVIAIKSQLFAPWAMVQAKGIRVTSWEEMAKTLIESAEEAGLADKIIQRGPEQMKDLLDGYVTWVLSQRERHLAELGNISREFPYPSIPEAQKRLTALSDSLFSSGEFGHG